MLVKYIFTNVICMQNLCLVNISMHMVAADYKHADELNTKYDRSAVCAVTYRYYCTCKTTFIHAFSIDVELWMSSMYTSTLIVLELLSVCCGIKNDSYMVNCIPSGR